MFPLFMHEREKKTYKKNVFSIMWDPSPRQHKIGCKATYNCTKVIIYTQDMFSLLFLLFLFCVYLIFLLVYVSPFSLLYLCIIQVFLISLENSLIVEELKVDILFLLYVYEWEQEKCFQYHEGSISTIMQELLPSHTQLRHVIIGSHKQQ
jgi:hypothetical protein